MRLGLVSGGLALAVVGAGAACSSSSNPASGGNTGDSGPTPTGDGGGDGGCTGPGPSSTTVPPAADAGGVPEGGGASIDGGGMACTPQTQEYVAAIFTLDVTWPAVLAANGGSGQLYIWSMSNYMINGSSIAGTTLTCGNQLLPLPLNGTGRSALGLPSTGTVQVLIELPTALTWDNVSRTAPVTGTLGGWNVGSSISINPVTSIEGLKPTSTYANPATPWPSAGTAFMPSDLQPDDTKLTAGDNGIIAYPLNNTCAGFYLPATGLGTGSPVADEIYLVTRTTLSLYGTSTSCTESSGAITVSQLQNHPIGCHVQGGSDCTAAEWQFIDSNTTVYSGLGGAGTPIEGTFQSKQIMGADGGAPTCDDVIAAFPSPAPQPPITGF